MDWYRQELRAGNAWLRDLPDCPCVLWVWETTLVNKRTGKPCQPSDAQEDKVLVKTGVKRFIGDTDYSEPEPPFDPLDHPGADLCIRSTQSASGAGQQCCYDKDGKLITGGRGAGTPDKDAPDGWWEGLNAVAGTGHMGADVYPFRNAVRADNMGHISPTWHAGVHVKQYWEVRRPNQGNKNRPNQPVVPCDKNIVDG
jgi:hypothetical protein